MRKTNWMRAPAWMGAVAIAVVIGGMLLGSTTSKAATANVTVGTPTNRFAPNSVTINTGDTVTFTLGAGTHVVDLKNASPDLPINSTTTSGVTNAFTTAGTYYYYCSIHAAEADATEQNVAANSAMVGKIVVNQQGTATATPSPSPSPTATATATPSPSPSPTATASATPSPSPSPTATATTPAATSTPTRTPTLAPTLAPTNTPTRAPTTATATVVAPGPPNTGSGSAPSAAFPWVLLIAAVIAVAATAGGVVRLSRIHDEE